MAAGFDPSVFQNNGSVSQDQYNQELANIAQQANVFTSLGIPENLVTNYATNAGQMARNSSSPYYTGGLSVTGQENAAIDNLNQLSQGGDGSGIPSPTGALANRIDAGNQGAMAAIKPLTDLFGTVGDIKSWTLPRAAVVVVGIIMLIAGIMMLSSKEVINIAPSVAKTVAENPEMVA